MSEKRKNLKLSAAMAMPKAKGMPLMNPKMPPGKMKGAKRAKVSFNFQKAG